MSVVKHTSNNDDQDTSSTYDQWPTDFFKGLADMKQARAVVT